MNKMGAFGVYFLKILCLYAVFSVEHVRSVGGAVLSQLSTDGLYRKYLKLRTLPFEDCGSQYDILYLNINSCSSIPCPMTRDSTVSVNVLFDDNGNDTNFLKHTVRWIFNAVRTDATITPDPCDGNHQCITNDTEGKSYWASVYVDYGLPVIGGTMLWEAVNENNENVICFKVPVVISV